MIDQLSFFELDTDSQQQAVINTLESYDYFIVAFSGGKDSTASFLHLLDLGVDKSKIELWHHDIDGKDSPRLFDWNCTDSYCRAFAKAFDVPIYYSWKVGGFEAEMNREDQKSIPTIFEYPGGQKTVGGNRGKAKTVKKFPAVGAIENGRWCSAILKIDVSRIALNNQERFENKKVLLITGERAQESPRRATYNAIEVHKSDNRDGKKVVRHIDQWRPVLFWDEMEVWEIIAKYKVNVHPAYHLGINRVSCAYCIFASPDQLATVKQILPDQGKRISDYEVEFNHTIRKTQTLDETIAKGKVRDLDSKYVELARTFNYNEPILLETFTLPAGAYGDSAGPS